MSSKRNPNAVTARILEVCIDGAGKTKVIYQANLNSATGKYYLNNLAKNGLIEAIPDDFRFIYRTTSKGRELQEKLGQFRSMMEYIRTHA